MGIHRSFIQQSTHSDQAATGPAVPGFRNPRSGPGEPQNGGGRERTERTGEDGRSGGRRRGLLVRRAGSEIAESILDLGQPGLVAEEGGGVAAEPDLAVEKGPLGAVFRRLAGLGARRRAAAVRGNAELAVVQVARDLVVDPVERELAARRRLRDVLTTAAEGRS